MRLLVHETPEDAWKNVCNHEFHLTVGSEGPSSHMITIHQSGMAPQTPNTGNGVLVAAQEKNKTKQSQQPLGT